ncbi:Nuclear-pore anchor [Abeliophyllum distichum]|uniref:Nuclear-pore anchor n=1 Tax=Abeliophyllum distichum TaxID=126358 RepID=A0ABD1UGJ7_9LAMI
MQVTMREKDAQLEEIKKLVSEKQDAISHLEQDLARSKTELNERESRINEILQAEASLKTEVERFKRSNVQLRRKLDNLSKEKEDLNKEIQVLSKQLEDAKQVKRNLGDAAGEQAMKEKEREKDTRIHILEKTLERHREDLKKEKEDRNKEKEKSQKNRKIILDSYESVTQQRTKLLDELDKHKQALKTLHDEVDKLKNSKGSQSESTSVVHRFTGTLLEDFSAAYFQAVENFEQVALPVRMELEASTSTDPPPLDTSSAGATIVQAGPAITQNILPPPAAANVPATKTVEEREKRFTIPKTNVKTGRKLVRPSITKPKEPQGDVEMSEADESNNGVKQTSSQNIETQGNLVAPTPSLVRKRPSASFSSDLQEDVQAPEETSSDMTAPVLKKSKGTETQKEGGEEQSTATLKVLQVSPPPEELPEDVENVHQDIKEEPVDAERDELATAGEEVDEPTADGKNQAELQSDVGDVAEENLDKPSEAVVSDEQLRYQTEQDIQHIVTESENDREEGELVTDDGDTEGNAIASNAMGGPGIAEFQPDHATSESSLAADEPLEVGEIDPSQVLDEEKNGGGEMTEDIVESSDKTNDGTDQVVADTDQVPGDASAAGQEATTNTTVETGASEQGGSTVTSAVEGKQTSPVTSSSSTTINWQERARQRASIRQAGMLTPSPGRARGSGRANRGRGARGGRTGRGQTPG